jgi:hypothetical protein
MASFVFRCPNRNVAVQGWIADDPPDDSAYTAVQCTACRQVHFINGATGRVLGSADEDE